MNKFWRFTYTLVIIYSILLMGVYLAKLEGCMDSGAADVKVTFDFDSYCVFDKTRTPYRAGR